MNKINVVFVCTGAFGVPILENLAKNRLINIPFVVTGVDKPAGRHLRVVQSPVKTKAQENQIIVLQPESIDELNKKIIQSDPDFLLVVSYGEILEEKILSIPKYGAVNIHASLLPKYRGASPIQEAILNGDSKTGISWIRMNKYMDQGDIIDQKELAVSAKETFTALEEKLSNVATLNSADVLEKYILNPTAKKQEGAASYCRKITKKDGMINVYQEEAEAIERKIRAYEVWPGCHIFWNGKRMKILDADTVEQNFYTGEVKVLNGNLYIGTKKKTLLPRIVQLEGKSKMRIVDFIRGQKEIPAKI